MSLTIPYSFTGGTKAKASEVNANFAAVVAKFSQGAGGILNEDCSTSMALSGLKISTTPGSRVPTAAIEDDAITTDKLKDDPSTDSPAAAVGSANQIKARIITGAKLVLATVSKAELKVTVSTVTLATGPIGPSGVAYVSSGSFSPSLPASSAAIPIAAWSEGATTPGAMVVELFVDTGTNTLRLAVKNTHDSVSMNPSGTVIKVAWLSLT